MPVFSRRRAFCLFERQNVLKAIELFRKASKAFKANG